MTDYLSQMWKVVKTLLSQNISAGGAGGEGFFAGSRFGGFTKQMLLIWSILAGLWIHNNRFLQLWISNIVFRIWIRKLDEHWTLIMYKKNISRICYRFGDGLRVSLFCHTLK